ncbi:MAG: MBL fold metallo-hydrolase [Candidatus Moraniibacteriota bacterium]|nr:MAG: MBL fold metallo-hydrolase [Candidatus Moranbacteria bacterium]
MAHQVDYIPVGVGKKGGDAIAIRYGDFSSPQTQHVIVIDGGTRESGKALVEHVKTHYGTLFVDAVIASHLHNDHISGLSEVLEGLTVGKLIVHCPWDYTKTIQKMTNTTVTQEGLKKYLEKSLGTLSTLTDLASEKGIPIVQPFAGEEIHDGLYVLGPTKEYYQLLLANFGVTPEVKEEHKIEQFIGAVKEAVSWVAEALHIETLSDDYPDTCPENNSCLVLLLVVDGKRFLFTGDAGKEGLGRAIDFAEERGVSLNKIDFLDVPHHGSKRNLGPTLLNRLMPLPAFISCPLQGDPKHPSRKVVNALIRRGCSLGSTRKGVAICHPSEDAPQRPGWGPLTPEVFFNEVEV